MYATSKVTYTIKSYKLRYLHLYALIHFTVAIASFQFCKAAFTSAPSDAHLLSSTSNVVISEQPPDTTVPAEGGDSNSSEYVANSITIVAG